MTAGLLAAIWLLGLFAAAPALRTGARYAFVDRLRDASILGIAIPLALGFVHLLYPSACWCALALCGAIVWARRRRPAPSEARGASAAAGRYALPYLSIVALTLVAWPALIRPLLDGDSVSYHLPNAASWVQAHSVWTTATRYWWYPPASEMFASALYAVAGPFAIGWSGLAALALLGFRIAHQARETFAASPLLADALAAATVTAAPLAMQGGTLQNDVWLAAFWLETLCAIGCNDGAAMRSIAVTALLKPYGWFFALAAALASRAPAMVWLAGAGALIVWIGRDALLWGHAALPASAAYGGAAFGTSIAGHGWPALALLVRVAFAGSPFALIALLAALFAPFAARGREARLGLAACAGALFFLIVPFGYDNAVAQLATGASLRYAAPAIALGALLLARPAPRLAGTAVALLILSTAYGAYGVLALYWNDAPTRTALLAALLAACAVAAARAVRSWWPMAAWFAVAVIVATVLADRHPADFYADALRVGGKASGVYTWIARERPPAIGGWGLRTGIVNVLSPATRTIDLPDIAPCERARSAGVLFVAVAEQDRTPSFNRERLATARACGAILYDDGLAVVSDRRSRAAK